jgi:hypothetical protein
VSGGAIAVSSSAANPARTYLNNPIWFVLFVVLGLLFLIPVGLLVRFLTGLSSSSDVVFGCEAFLARLLINQVFRRRLHKQLMLLPKPEIPFNYAWIVLCAYVTIVRPFEH